METFIHILLVEDDENLGFVTKDNLEMRGYQVNWAKNGQEGYEQFLADKYDLCMVDVMMPQKDGFELARDIRKVNEEVPLFFLTAKSLPEDKIRGLKIGADDYITKPFNMDELVLRIENTLKRTRFRENLQTRDVFTIGQFTFNARNYELTIDNETHKLTKKEAELLRLLCLHEGEVLEREVALRVVWGNDDYFLGRSMDVFITKLRKYLKADPNVSIENMHGIGFTLRTEPE